MKEEGGRGVVNQRIDFRFRYVHKKQVRNRGGGGVDCRLTSFLYEEKMWTLFFYS